MTTLMDQMEKVPAVRTRRYNDFPSSPVQEVEQPLTGKRLWFFEDGSAEMKDLLGGKGAGLAEMTRAKLPVPPGFTLTTEVCLAFYDAGRRLPDGLPAEIRAAMRELEQRTGKGFGKSADPLLVSVRSGARVSMPGMMDTILNLGLNDASVKKFAEIWGNERLVYDSYRRFIMMYGEFVSGVSRKFFDQAFHVIKMEEEVEQDIDLSINGLKMTCDVF